MKPGIAVVASGLVTPVGFNSAASCAAIRAGISGVQPANLRDPESGESIVGAKVPLPQWWEGTGKLAELAAPAIAECLDSSHVTSRDQVALLLGVAEASRPHRFEDLDATLLGEVEFRLGLPRHPASALVPHGHVSGVIALREAARVLAERRAQACVVAGADSFLRQSTVESYVDRRRIMTPANSNGFIPGEAGSAVLVMAADVVAGPCLDVMGIGVGEESGPISGTKPQRADGLTSAIRAALINADVSIYDVAYRLTDLNGEHYKFKEATFATTRLHRERREDLFDIWHPIQSIGEVGAAIGPCLFAVSFDAMLKGYAHGPTVLCHFSSDGGLRAAAVLRARGG